MALLQHCQLEGVDHLVGVGDHRVDPLGQVQDGLGGEQLEQGDVLEQAVVALLEQVAPHILGQLGYQMLLLLEIELMLHLDGLLDVVAYFLLNLSADGAALNNIPERLQILLLLLVLGPNVKHQLPHAVDRVGQRDAGHELQED